MIIITWDDILFRCTASFSSPGSPLANKSSIFLLQSRSWKNTGTALRPLHTERQWLIWGSTSTLVSYLINWDRNPILEWLAWFIKKTEEFNQNDIASDIPPLMLALCVNVPSLVTYTSFTVVFRGHLTLRTKHSCAASDEQLNFTNEYEMCVE